MLFIFTILVILQILNAEVYNQRVRDFEENRNSGSERSPLAYLGALGGVLLGMALWVIVGLIGFIVGIIGAVIVCLSLGISGNLEEPVLYFFFSFWLAVGIIYGVNVIRSIMSGCYIIQKHKKGKRQNGKYRICT